MADEIENAKQQTGNAKASGATTEARLASAESKIATLTSQLEALQLQVAQAKLPATATDSGSTAVTLPELVQKLERHGIRVTDEDREANKADGSGSERWGQGETWTEAHDESGAPIPISTVA